jgi:ubiquitin-conjugating enzyme E2 N
VSAWRSCDAKVDETKASDVKSESESGPQTIAPVHILLELHTLGKSRHSVSVPLAFTVGDLIQHTVALQEYNFSADAVSLYARGHRLDPNAALGRYGLSNGTHVRTALKRHIERPLRWWNKVAATIPKHQLALSAHRGFSKTVLCRMLRKSLKMTMRTEPVGVSAVPFEHWIGKYWQATIQGPEDDPSVGLHSPYSGGQWTLCIELPERFPFEAPSIHFHTPISHPNVDEVTGEICAAGIVSCWTPSSLLDVLIDVRARLSCPQVDVDDDPQLPPWDEQAQSKAREWTRLYAQPTVWKPVRDRHRRTPYWFRAQTMALLMLQARRCDSHGRDMGASEPYHPGSPFLKLSWPLLTHLLSFLAPPAPLFIPLWEDEPQPKLNVGGSAAMSRQERVSYIS